MSASSIRGQLDAVHAIVKAQEADLLTALRTANMSGTTADRLLARRRWLLASGITDEVGNAVRVAGGLVDP